MPHSRAFRFLTLALLFAMPSLAIADEPPVPTAEQRLTDLELRLEAVEQRLAELEWADSCEDTRQQALDFTTLDGAYETSVPALWNGTPFVVDVSNALPNADQLLELVGQEAAKIEASLGYQVFVAGEVKYLPNLDRTSVVFLASRGFANPPDQHIELRCCDEGGVGTAFPWWRLILLPTLENDDAAFLGGHAVINLVHELYHLLGFVHQGEVGIEMSDDLQSALNVWYTTSTPADLDNLAWSCPVSVDS